VAGPAATAGSPPRDPDAAGSAATAASTSRRGRARARSALPADFYDRPVLEVARALIGCVVEHQGVVGAIVETEAYHECEPACHAFVGLTPRTRTLFGAPGRAYVYRSYGIHAMLNAVCEPPGVGAAVLIRALEPLDGVESMRARRGAQRSEELCSGPGKLTQALGVELAHNDGDLAAGPVLIGPPQDPSWLDLPVVVGVRVGIAKAVELPWRFCVADNRHVSRPRPRSESATPRPRG
jgi:DNA-3-methyladenine glycosylase